MAEKRAMIERDHPKLSVRRECELLSFPRSSYYRGCCGESCENLELMKLSIRFMGPER